MILNKYNFRDRNLSLLIGQWMEKRLLIGWMIIYITLTQEILSSEDQVRSEITGTGHCHWHIWRDTGAVWVIGNNQGQEPQKSHSSLT